MTRVCRTLGLMLALAVMAGGTVTLVTAQEKGKVAPQKKDDKKADKKAAKGGTIEINEGKDGKYRFTIRDADGKLLAMSGPSGFATKDDAEKALDTLKEVLPTAKIAPGKKAEK